MLELIIFAGLAAVVLFQLYSVLGRRVGRQPEDTPAADALPGAKPAPDRLEGEEVQAAEVAEGVALSGLAAVRARDGSFDLPRFLGGAKGAYEMIVTAFAAGDRDTLRDLLSPGIMASFDAEIARRETEGRTETVEFAHPPRADLEKAEVVGDVAKITVRFLAEFRSRTKGPEGEGVDDRRTAELWTFERNLKSRDPNWTLVRVDAAEA
ncbi:TIM44-related membrane protein TimA [Phenylobacterium sp.]|uniref:TIM44-related membrane protein TimA n=1 Tax=Phenylobacterium sp. TaxID=1871053 RepID=UPI002716741F|nr:TIM44-related membrane protein TimA [Phenylobacterium sp.]MDO8378947.1 TIM44-related membrane protein TimA [Phenylobacterium sp.]